VRRGGPLAASTFAASAIVLAASAARAAMEPNPSLDLVIYIPAIVILLAAWIAALLPLRGSPTAGRAVFGLVLAAFALGLSLFTCIVMESSRVPAWIAGGGVGLAHLGRMAAALFARATGGRSKETARKFWRAL
jgi:hypothetical protein